MATLDSEEIRHGMTQARLALRRLRRNASRLVDRDALTRLLLALCLAFGFWMFVTVRNNPYRTLVVRNVPIEVRGQIKEFVLMRELSPAEITIGGPLSLVEAPNVRVNAFVDLTNRSTAGIVRVPIQVDLPSGIRREGIVPEEVFVELEPLHRLEFPVTVGLSPQPPGVRPDQATVEPRMVSIAGARSTLEQIARVVVRPDPGAEIGNLTRTVRPVPLDSNGNIVTGPMIEISPPAVRVTLPSAIATGSKSVTVQVKYQGQPAPGYKVDNIRTTPSLVTVTGETAALAILQAIDTETINFDKSDRTIDQMVPLKLPNGIRTDQTNVRVEVIISAIQTSQAQILIIGHRGLSPNQRVEQIVPGTVTVTMKGPIQRLGELDVGTLRVEVDLRNKAPGIYQLPAELTGSGLAGLEVTLQPSLVSVTIVNDATRTPTPTATPMPTVSPTRAP